MVAREAAPLGSSRESDIKSRSETRRTWDVLMVSSDPSAHQRLKLQAEERAIRQSISLAEHGRHVDINLDVLPAATADDLAKRLLWKSSQGSSYDVIHFSGHCDVDNHLVRLIFSELHRQHGPEVVRRFQSSSASVSGIHELAAQVTKHLESQAMYFMDEIDVPSLSSSARSITAAESSIEAVVETHSKSRSLTPDFRLIHRAQTKAIIPADAEQRVGEQRLLVFSQASEGPADPSQMAGNGGPSRPGTPDSTSVEVWNDHDPLVLRLPDGGPHATKDIVLTKSQILDAGVGSLAFEMGGGPGMNFVSAKAFADLVSPYALDLQCILLNACHSQLACEQLLAVGIPLAICARGKMSDASALHFSRGFYEALAYGESVERAFVEGQNRMSVNDRRRYHPGPAGHPTTALAQQHARFAHAMPHPHPHPDHVDVVCLFRASGSMRLSPVSVRRHHDMDSENKSLRRMIQEGIWLLGTKDREIQELRELVEEFKEREKAQSARAKTPSRAKTPARSDATTRRRESSGIRINPARAGSRRASAKTNSASKQGSQRSQRDGEPKLATNARARAARPRAAASSSGTKSRVATESSFAGATASTASSRRKSFEPQDRPQDRAKVGVESSMETPPAASGPSIKPSSPWKLKTGRRAEARDRIFTSATSSATVKGGRDKDKENRSGSQTQQAPRTPTRPRKIFTTASATAAQSHAQSNGSPPGQQGGQAQPSYHGFGSSVPRFSTTSVPHNPGRYDCASPKTRTKF
ncbi:Hypothetical Protein FCC1311_103922 [Hondaea fermentalgiana]|uniref:CHAT domain-containing protein n=1 Tax=Hondaea fermentalgiana TaxID=2315210 RepID=A0A2R5GWM1_9STRA|nr:Hypothetical Protein FCC1311_103922 [Hondaea fermentalgiana]|eukprot:GBG34168.1 Hypothetical Protein FCC1311_103922 [Hondaea fermentalgiana]